MVFAQPGQGMNIKRPIRLKFLSNFWIVGKFTRLGNVYYFLVSGRAAPSRRRSRSLNQMRTAWCEWEEVRVKQDNEITEHKYEFFAVNLHRMNANLIKVQRNSASDGPVITTTTRSRAL